MKKNHIYLFLVILFSAVILPLPCVVAQRDRDQNADTLNSEYTFRVFMHNENKVVTLSERDYLCGVVAAEIGGEYHEEAIKAQAVAAYSLAIYTKEHGGDKKDLKGADFSDDCATFQSYMTKEQFKKREGENWESDYKRIEKAVNEVYGEVLTFDGETAQSVYHAISGGRTESSEVAFGSSAEYLTPVPSVGDLLSKDYQTEVSFTPDELKDKLKSYKIKWEDDPKKWFSGFDISESGTVRTVSVCGETLTGGQVRTAMGLRSANFEESYTDGKFLFICRGYGHGVGMSQNGAEYMAAQGSSYREILAWYYNGCDIKNIRNG